MGSVCFHLSAQEKEEIKKEEIIASRHIRYAQLNDPYRTTWHLTIAEGNGFPFDPNGAIFKDGIYHLWHLYVDTEGNPCWQHLSSIDLFHWRWHSNILQCNPGDPGTGIFSGNAFLANDGNVVIAYHGYQSGGNCIAYSSDDELNIWTKPKANPTVSPGWDPHMWQDGDTFFQISGGTTCFCGVNQILPYYIVA